MILNIILIITGVALLFYGLKEKLKMWIVIGLVLLGCGLFSTYVDYRTYGIESITNPNYRIPFIIDHMM